MASDLSQFGIVRIKRRGGGVSTAPTRGLRGWHCLPTVKAFFKVLRTLGSLVVRVHRESKGPTGLDDIGNEEEVAIASAANTPIGRERCAIVEVHP